MNAWKVILATAVIFAAGVLTGGVLSWRLQAAGLMRRQHNLRAPQPFSPGGLRFDFLRRAQRELDLSPEQRERVDRILKESQERTRLLMEPVAPELRQEVQRTKDEFRNVLTLEQQKRFDELIKKQSHSREPRQPGGPPSPLSPERARQTNS